MVKTSSGPVTPAQLARRLYRESNSVKMTLDRMERDGLISKIRDLPSKNQIRIVLTEKGEKKFEEMSDNKSIEQIMSVLSPKDRDILTSLLKALGEKAFQVYQEVQQTGQKLPLAFNISFPAEPTLDKK